MPVPVTGFKVHCCIFIFRITPEGVLDKTQVLDKLPPVHRIKETEAVYAVPKRHLISRLALCLCSDHLFNGQVSLGKSLFYPVEGE